MANNPYVNKVVYGNQTLLDLSQDTASSASHIRQGYTAHLNDGTQVTGTYSGDTPTLQSKTYNVSSAGTATVTADSGYDGLSSVAVSVPSADPWVAYDYGYIGSGSNLKWQANALVEISVDAGDTEGWLPDGYNKSSETVVLNAIPSNTTVTPTESAQTIGGENTMMEDAVTVAAIPSNYVGSGITRRSSTDLTASGATVTVPSGYYSAQASKAVASGTAGTPTATKGTVSNHQVSVTPSVTNTTGWITGSTKTGTAVTVSASELVSGSQTVTTNDTYDVTNLAELVVDVSGGSVTWVTEYDGNVTIVADSPNYVVINNWTPSHPTFADGQTWRVTWKGTEYVCPVKELSSQGSPVSYIGNGQIVGATDTSNEPFFGYMRTPTQLAFVTTDSAGTITLKMELQQSSSATLIEKTITANGTYDAEDDDADGYSKVTVTVSGSSKNVQVLQSTTRTNSGSLAKVLGDLTVSKTGTYDIYWSACRTSTSTSYTWGSRLYVDGSGYGTENTSWSDNVQNNHLTNVSLTANQKLSVYTRGRSGSYYTFAPMLVIIEA